ncbi:MAG: hypothetical protein AAGK21_02260 [Bacteroidota bacterium]
MPTPLPPTPSRRDARAPTRALACLAASLSVVNAAFLLWPDIDVDTGIQAQPAPPEMLMIEVVDQTVQPPPGYIPPAPPPPPVEVELPPEEVPDDVIIDEIISEMELPAPPAPSPSRSRRQEAPMAPPGPPGPPAPPAPSGPPPADDRIVERPDRSPRLRGQALPVYPQGADDFRGRARVRVLVSPGGQVTEAEIVERITFRRGREEAVASFPPAFERAVLDAARRHLFSPARDDGQRVRAYAFLTIALDPPD